MDWSFVAQRSPPIGHRLPHPYTAGQSQRPGGVASRSITLGRLFGNGSRFPRDSELRVDVGSWFFGFWKVGVGRWLGRSCRRFPGSCWLNICSGGGGRGGTGPRSRRSSCTSWRLCFTRLIILMFFWGRRSLWGSACPKLGFK